MGNISLILLVLLFLFFFLLEHNFTFCQPLANYNY